MTADTAALDRLGPPWWYGLFSETSELNVLHRALLDSGLVAPFLRGAAMRTTDGLFDEFSHALQFPDYFGRNWPALDECLADLSWLPGRAYVLVIQDSMDVLADEPSNQFEVLLKVLAGVGAEWAKPIARGESWDRPAVPFHALFHGMPERGSALQARFERGGFDLQPVVLQT